MGMRIDALRVQVTTTQGTYGIDETFNSGLVVIRADNTSGKSTAIQAIVWALGLEGMYGPSKTPPLTPAVLTAIADDETALEFQVLESSVYLQVSNDSGQVLTVHRWIVHVQASTDLIETWDAPLLTEPATIGKQRDYYVRLAGAAQAEAGFHALLARFLGWQLPTILRNDGSLSLLYLECIFPTAIVEQKRGWSGLFAVMPWHLRIPEMASRSIEYVLNLDAYESAQRRREIQAQSELVAKEWADAVSSFRDRLEEFAGALQGVPGHPALAWPPSVSPSVLIATSDDAVLLPTLLESLRADLHEISAGKVPTVGQVAQAASSQLAEQEDRLRVLQSFAAQTAEELEVGEEQLVGLRTREEALRIDLSRYNDLRRLRELGSETVQSEIAAECPTCHQELPDSLLLKVEAPTTMEPQANVNLIREQLRTFGVIKGELEKRVSLTQRRLTAIRNESTAIRSQVRSLRSTLVGDEKMPAIATIERQVRLTDRISKLQDLEQSFAGFITRLGVIAKKARDLAGQRASLGPEGLSDRDEATLQKVSDAFTQQLIEYGFRSYPIQTIGLSQIKYTPEHQGVELSYGLSASDLVRTIWAYMLALFQVADRKTAHHPGFVVFDEPRQQDAAQVSFDALLKRAATVAEGDGQVIVATSDEEENVRRALGTLPYQYIGFKGRVLRRLT